MNVLYDTESRPEVHSLACVGLFTQSSFFLLRRLLWEAHYRWLGGDLQTRGMLMQMNLLLDPLILCLHHLCQVFFTFSEWKSEVKCGQNTIIATSSCIILHPADLLRTSLKAGQLHLWLSSLWESITFKICCLSPLNCPSIFKPRSYSKCVLSCPNSGS